MSRCNSVITNLWQSICRNLSAVSNKFSADLARKKAHWLNLTFTAMIVIMIAACGAGGGGGGGGGGTNTGSAPISSDFVVSGTVLAPGGSVAFLPQTNLFAKFTDILFSSAYAAISGLASVPDGTRVDLVRIDKNGLVLNTLATTKTTTGGSYSFNLTKLGLTTANDLVVQVLDSSNVVKMRAFVASDTVNIDPASETAVRLVLEKSAISSLNNFTVQELADIGAAVNLLAITKPLAAGLDIDSTVTAFKNAIAADANITSFIISASAAGQTSQGLGDIGNYFPFDPGNTWVYQGTEESGGITTPYTNTLQITGSKLINGITTTIFHETNSGNNGTPSDDYRVKDSQAVTNDGNSDPADFLTPQVAPYREYRFPLGLNTSFQPFNKSGVIWTLDLDGDGKSETADISASQTVVSFETVTVLAGTYANTAKIVTNINITIRLSGNGTTVTDATTVTEWYAPDIGLVKSTSVEQATRQGNTSTSTTTEELTQFSPRLSFSSITVGAYHSCGVTKVGKAYCWGENGGRLGNGSTVDSSKPVAVSGGLTFISLSAGGAATCGITTGGAAYCWGNNGSGQLGNDTQASSTVPVPVSGGLAFTSVSVGLFHVCGIATTGAAYCWGDNSDGELGYGTLPGVVYPVPGGPPTPVLISTVPVPVSGGQTFTSLSASRIYFAGGSYTCGLATGGAAYCWGSNLMGALGIGDITLGNRSVPAPVLGGLTFISLTTEFGTCGVTPSNSTYCWGGQIDNTGAIAYIPAPMLVPNGIKFVSLSAKGDHVCGVSINGAAYCWGMNSNGQTGNGATSYYVFTPATVSGGIQFSSVSVGESHTCGVSTDGTGYCWGWNFWGQLGNSTMIDSSVPAQVTSLP